MAWNRDAVLTLLKEAAAGGAVEVHFKVPGRPMLRSPQGTLLPANAPPLSAVDATSVAVSLGQLAGTEFTSATVTDLEFGFGVAGVGRFRASIYRQRGTLSAVVRCLRSNPPSFADLGVPDSVDRLVGRAGLLIVCGNRHRELLAACIHAFNARERGHAVVIESAITTLHRDAMATVAQREVGVDVGSHAAGVRAAINAGADLIAVDQIPDAATTDAVLCAAERGISVVAAVAATEPKDAAWFLTRTLTGEFRLDAELRIHRTLRAVISVPRDGKAVVTLPDTALELPA